MLLHTLHVFMTAINPAKKSLATPNTDEEAEIDYVFKVHVHWLSTCRR